MHDSLVLRSRVVAILDEIEQARVALERIREFEPALHEGVAPRFERTLTAEHARMTTLADSLHADSLKAGGGNESGWALLRRARSVTTRDIREIHAFVQSAVARRDGLDRGVLKIADVLLDELSSADVSRARMTVLADREYYGELAEMIRLRFPDTTLWSIPVVAHEFSHFLVRSLRVAIPRPPPRYRYPFEDLLDSTDSHERSRLEELVADIFATYAIGPAYGLMCVTLRFDTTERTAVDDHPSTSVRVEAILRSLRELTPDERDGHPYAAIADVIRNTWNELRGNEMTAVTPYEQSDLALLDEQFAAVRRVLEDVVPQTRYRTFRVAEKLAPILLNGTLSNAIAPGIADTLNAAWLARLRAHSDQKVITRLERDSRILIERRISSSDG